MFSLGADYLVSRVDVDTTRLIMVATSFAVPFAAQTAAFDERFANVGLVYGAGRMEEVLAANLTMRPRFLRAVAAWFAMRPYRWSPVWYSGWAARSCSGSSWPACSSNWGLTIR